MFPVRVAAPHGSVHDRATPRSGGGVTAAHSTACGGSAPRHRLRCPARVSLEVPPGTGSAAWPHTPLEMPSTPRDAVPCLLPVHPLRAYTRASRIRYSCCGHSVSRCYGWRERNIAPRLDTHAGSWLMTARTKGRQPREELLSA
jgi:hypothetical protein